MARGLKTGSWVWVGMELTGGLWLVFNLVSREILPGGLEAPVAGGLWLWQIWIKCWHGLGIRGC